MDNRSIRRMTRHDYKTIASWYRARNRSCPTPGTLSDLGFICDERVAGWIYTTNSNMAMIEGIISNPDTIPSFRRESLKKLTAFLIDYAIAQGYSNIFGIGIHPSIANLANQMGFKQAEFKIWTLSEKE